MSWRPLPARRVFIPKPGRGELRPLSIPAVRDGVLAAVKIVIEPIFDDLLVMCKTEREAKNAHDGAHGRPGSQRDRRPAARQRATAPGSLNAGGEERR